MKLDSLVPMTHVADVARSLAFYRTLGFEVKDTHTPTGTDVLQWAWLQSGGAHLMLTRADEPVVPQQQAVLFYVYCDDLGAYRDALVAAGVDLGPITKPFYNPRGEFRVVDPDGYVLMITHT